MPSPAAAPPTRRGLPGKPRRGIVSGVGLGAALRSTAAAIALAVALTYLAPEILSLLPSPWNGRIGRFLPLTAAQQLVSLHPRTDMFAPALSLLVLAGWAVAVLAAACVITRRDA